MCRSPPRARASRVSCSDFLCVSKLSHICRTGPWTHFLECSQQFCEICLAFEVRVLNRPLSTPLHCLKIWLRIHLSRILRNAGNHFPEHYFGKLNVHNGTGFRMINYYTWCSKYMSFLMLLFVCFSYSPPPVFGKYTYLLSFQESDEVINITLMSVC